MSTHHNRRLQTSFPLLALLTGYACSASDGASPTVANGTLLEDADPRTGLVVGFNISPRPSEFDPEARNTACGAALVGPRHLVTAAHCVWRPEIFNLSIRPFPTVADMEYQRGTSTLRFFRGSRKFADSYTPAFAGGEGVPPLFQELPWEAASISVHPAFPEARRSAPGTYDIAVIAFDGQVPEPLAPLPMASPETDLAGHKLHLLGYGFARQPAADGSLPLDRLVWPNRLRHGLVTVASEDRTRRILQLAARAPSGAAPCKGDSGSPVLERMGNGSFQLAGVVSHNRPGANCEEGGAVLTDVRLFADWVRTEFAALGHPLPDRKPDRVSRRGASLQRVEERIAPVETSAVVGRAVHQVQHAKPLGMTGSDRKATGFH